MQIIEISEPGQNPKKTNEQQELIVGIDFGTTNSLIALSKSYQVEFARFDDDNKLLASLIGWQDEKIIVGHAASSAADKIKSIKRLLAKSFAEIRQNQPNSLFENLVEINGQPQISFGHGKLQKSIPEIAAEIFKKLKANASDYFGQVVQKSVISVPAYFDEVAKGQIMLAAKLAGFEVVRLISEPVAAAYAYGLSKNYRGTYLVYDLGGGTFDLSILEMQEGVLQVIASGGDNLLGGDDFDQAIAAYLSQKYQLVFSAGLVSLAREIKENFTKEEKTEFKYQQQIIILSKIEYEEIISPIIDKTIEITQKLIKENKTEQLVGIILVGGSTRMPQIQAKLANIFQIELFNKLNPDEVVAMGAAMQAENLSSKSSALIIDVIPLSVGLELYGGIVEKIIERNTQIPYSVTKEFTTQADNQTAMQFHIVQGERELAVDCRSLAKFELKNIKLAKAGRAKIQVNFTIDADGLLSVTASDYYTGQMHNIEVKPSYGLEPQAINQLLSEAYKHAETDHEKRLLIETKSEAENLITGLNQALNETPLLLTDAENNRLITAINSLQNIINSDNRELIRQKSEKLNQLAADFIQKHLDQGAELFLKNKHINQIKFDRKNSS